MALRSLNFRVSGTDPTPTTSSLAKGRIVQTLRNGLALSFEISVIVLLLCFHLIQLASTRCLSVIAQFASPPKAQCSKTPRPHAKSQRYRRLAEDDDWHEPQQPQLNIPVSRTPLMRLSPLLLAETSSTQHKESGAVKEDELAGADSPDEWDVRSMTDDGCLLPVTPSKLSILARPPNTPESTNSPTPATIPTRPLSLVHQTNLHHDGEANLRESASTRQEGNGPNPLSAISISHKSIELHPSVVEPSLLQNPLSPPRPVAHIESPRRRVSENRTPDNRSASKSAKDSSPKLTDSLSYLRTLTKAKKGTAGSASGSSKRSQSHKHVPRTIPSERTPNTET